MSLINCPDCGKEISPNAKACPNCGGRAPKDTRGLLISAIQFAIGISLLMIAAFIFYITFGS